MNHYNPELATGSMHTPSNVDATGTKVWRTICTCLSSFQSSGTEYHVTVPFWWGCVTNTWLWAPLRQQQQQKIHSTL